MTDYNESEYMMNLNEFEVESRNFNEKDKFIIRYNY